MLLVVLVGNDGRVQDGVSALNVGTNHRESDVLDLNTETQHNYHQSCFIKIWSSAHEASNVVITTVELVVAEGHGIEPKLVQGLGDLLAAVVAVEECALGLVAHVEEEAVRVGGASTVDNGLHTSVASIAALGRARAVCAGARELVEVGMDVVDVVDGCPSVSTSYGLYRLCKTYRCCSFLQRQDRAWSGH
jgi:hypothetical protein